jgi:hypothetical protein
MMTRSIFIGCVALAWCLVCAAQQATKLPAPSRTVYKCVDKGKTFYSDDPCPNAEKLEVEPTRGVNKSTGVTREGADVRRENFNDAMAEAVKPLTGGKDAKQLDKAGRRMKLQPEAQLECARLELGITDGEQRERAAQPDERKSVQQGLYEDRRRFRQLRC